MIETYLLEHLAAFAKCGTLSEAAEELHLTQPTLTRSMNKLEEQFDVPLFTREKKRLYLNENGKLAAQYAEDILAMHENMQSQVRELNRRSRTIAIGSCAPGPLMELMPLLTNTFSDMTVTAETVSMDNLLPGLKDGTYQMIILDYPLDAPDLLHRRLYSQHCSSEQLCAALPQEHRFANAASVSFSDMDGENFLMVSNVGIWDDLVRNKMPSSKFLLQEGTDSLLQVAESSTLPSFVTDVTLRVLGNGSGRAIVPFSDSEAHMDFYCICPASERHRYKAWFQALALRVG